MAAVSTEHMMTIITIHGEKRDYSIMAPKHMA